LWVVQVTVMKIVEVIAVLNGGVAAARPVLVRMVGVVAHSKLLLKERKLQILINVIVRSATAQSVEPTVVAKYTPSSTGSSRGLQRICIETITAPIGVADATLFDEEVCEVSRSHWRAFLLPGS